MIDINSIMMWLGFIVLAIIIGIAVLLIYDWFQKRKMLKNCDKYLESEKKEEKVNGGEYEDGHDEKITYDNSKRVEVPEPAAIGQTGAGEQDPAATAPDTADSGRAEERRDIPPAASESSQGDSGRDKGFKGFADITEWRRDRARKMREKRMAKLAETKSR